MVAFRKTASRKKRYRMYPPITPRAFLAGSIAQETVKAGLAVPFLGGPRAFTMVQVGNEVRPARALSADQLAEFAQPRPSYRGLDLSRPVLMGVVNVTPDSFSDGGKFHKPESAIAHGVMLAEAGAAIIDVGGESTRPNATPVDEAEEIERVFPVVSALAKGGICVSIDTRHPRVMKAALDAGAKIINDVAALTAPGAMEIASKGGAAVILMHMQGTPQTMQDNPTYDWAPGDIFQFLEDRVAACIAAGIPKDRIAVDPGLGFGKTDAHNLQILDHLAMFHGLGCALAVGASRKGFVGRITGEKEAGSRMVGSVAAAIYAAGQGAQILRVHDVAETRQALMVSGQINGF